MTDENRLNIFNGGIKSLDKNDKHIQLGLQRYIHCVLGAKTKEEVSRYTDALARWHEKNEKVTFEDAREIESKKLRNLSLHINLQAGGSLKEKIERTLRVMSLYHGENIDEEQIQKIVQFVEAKN